MQKLLGNARQYFDVNSIKLIETHQAPAAHNPLKKFEIIPISMVGEQLNTTHPFRREDRTFDA